MSLNVPIKFSREIAAPSILTSSSSCRCSTASLGGVASSTVGVPHPEAVDESVWRLCFLERIVTCGAAARGRALSEEFSFVAVDFLLRFFFCEADDLLAALSVAAKSRPGMWRGCGGATSSTLAVMTWISAAALDLAGGLGAEASFSSEASFDAEEEEDGASETAWPLDRPPDQLDQCSFCCS